ncbi:MAG: MBL fold metallo-hydrolase [Candidatus Omnitrophota bacterium]
MILTLCGTGTGVPSLKRNPPCLLMDMGGKKAVFDSGPGALKTLLSLGVDQLNLDLLFYTHLHLDHISELSAILFAAKIPPDIRKKPLYIYGPKGIKDYYDKLVKLYQETLLTDSYELQIVEIGLKELVINDFKVSAKPIRHHGGGMGYRVLTPNGKSLIYSGDVDYCQEIVDLSKDADVLILECSFPDELKMDGHLTPALAGKIAKMSKAKKLILVHMYPICDKYDLIASCRKEFDGEIIVGEDLMQLEIK